MVVLSAYYLMTGDAGQVDVVTSETKEGQVETVDITGEVTGEAVGGADAAETNKTLNLTSANDFFVSYKMQRENLRSIEADKYMEIISDSENSNAEEIVKAQTRLEDMMALSYAETVIEEILSAEYGDAVVISNGGFVEVVVQAEALTNIEVVKILDLVTEQMAVPAHKVQVSGVKY